MFSQKKKINFSAEIQKNIKYIHNEQIDEQIKEYLNYTFRV